MPRPSRTCALNLVGSSKAAYYLLSACYLKTFQQPCNVMCCHGNKLLTRLDFAVFLSVCVSGHVNVLKWLNAKGDVSSTDTFGGSPLHDAAEQGQFEVSC